MNLGGAALFGLDWNRDELIDPMDMDAFLSDYLAGEADYNFSSETDASDFLLFTDDLMNRRDQR